MKHLALWQVVPSSDACSPSAESLGNSIEALLSRGWFSLQILVCQFPFFAQVADSAKDE